MINLYFSISNPFKRKDFQKDYFWKNIKLTENKSFEIQITRWTMNEFVEFDLDLNWNGNDHAGPRLHIELFGFMLDVKIYDHRHWDWDNWKWEEPEVDTSV